MLSPSPTIISAVKLKRRPPLTTFATRLIVTNRSMYGVLSWAAPPRPPSRRARRSRVSPLPPGPPPSRRARPGIRRSLPSCYPSELQTPLTGGVGQSGDATVVVVAAPVEDHGGDAGLASAGGHELADLDCVSLLVAVQRPDVGLERRGSGQRAARDVVDDLHDDVARAAVYREARAFGATEHLLPQPGVAAGTRDAALARHLRCRALPGVGGNRLSHAHLPVFPTLRRTFSPAYRTPLPLYGSGFRILRMLAAVSPTNCLSMPLTENRVGDSTAKEIPSGGSTTTGWLNPSANSRFLPFSATRYPTPTISSFFS